MLELRRARLGRGAALAECSAHMRGLAHNHRSGERTASSLHHHSRRERLSRAEDEARAVCVCCGGQVSSANYVARSFGIRASMGMQQARQLCATVVAVPYEFPKYTAAAEKMYRVLFATSPHVQVGVRAQGVTVSFLRGGATCWRQYSNHFSGGRFGFRNPPLQALARSVLQQDGAFTWRGSLIEWLQSSSIAQGSVCLLG